VNVVVGGSVVVGAAVDEVEDPEPGFDVVAVEVVDELAADKPLDDGVDDESRIDTAMKPMSTTMRATPAPVNAHGSHDRDDPSWRSPWSGPGGDGAVAPQAAPGEAEG
jgi:hypothetical protein